MAATLETKNVTKLAAAAAGEKLATNMVALDVSEPFVLAEVFLIVSASNERQLTAIANEVEDELHKHGLKPKMKEGKETARWILMDFGDLVVHIFHEDEREFYSLEKLWKDCPVVPLD